MKYIPATFRSYISVGLIFGLSHSLSAATYYVKNGGDDTLDGLSEDKAWATIGRVNQEELAPGDEVLFRSGDVFDDATLLPDSGNATAPVRYAAFGSGEKPVFTTAVTLSNQAWVEASTDVYRLSLPTETCMLVADGVYWPPAKSVEALVDGEYFWDSTGELYIKDSRGHPNVTGRQFRVGQRDNVVRFDGEDYVVLDGLRFEISNNSMVLVNWGSEENLIKNCDFLFASSDHVTAGAGVHANGATGLKVYDSRFRHMEGDGIYMQRADGYEVVGNEIDYIYDWGGDPGGDCIQISGKRGSTSDHFVVKDNIARRETKKTKKGCIIVEHGSHGVVSGNYVSKGRFGIACYSSDTVIEYNYLEDMGWHGAIRLWENRGQRDITIRYNIIDQAEYQPIPIGNQYKNSTPLENIVIRNNLLCGVNYGVVINVPVSGEFKNNIIWSPGATGNKVLLRVSRIIEGQSFESDHNILQDVPGDSPLISWEGTVYKDMASYQAATGQDLNSMSADPLWGDPSAKNFTLNNRSPAIDAGESPDSLTHDFYGNTAPAGSAIEIGPVESGS